jgi:large subunit ribosomal protein L4
MATTKKTATPKVAKAKKEPKKTEAISEATLYSTAGKSVGTVKLPSEIFGITFNSDLVHQVVTSMMSNARAGTADTKGRGEVRGGGRKPWKQKGTGRSRHGSTRSPIWKGGGVTLGPLAEKNYKKKINKKMRAKALYMVLASKLKEGNILFVDSLDFKTAKTKDASKAFMSLSKVSGFERLAGKKQTAVVAFPEQNKNANLAIRNLPQVQIVHTKDINPVDLLSSKYLVMTEPEKSFKMLLARMTK